MNKLHKLILASASTCLLYTAPLTVSAQGATGSPDITEIVIEGRNREELLQEVPVATTVVGQTMIDDAGITRLDDLFGLVPGLNYNEEFDRLGAQPSVRGVSSTEVSPNRVKVSAFVDGMPVLGNQGSIGFSSFDQVEIYRGPQSAAFGRSTFAGAINYTTKDPGEEWEGRVSTDFNDYGRRIAGVEFGGPISDTLGVIVQYEHEDSDTPDEYQLVGQSNIGDLGGVDGTLNANASDGTQLGTQSGDNVSAKFVFSPTDSLEMNLTFGHVETDDNQNAAFHLSEQAFIDCYDGNGLYAQGEMDGAYGTGTLDCDWDDHRALYGNHDIEGWLLANDAYLSELVAQKMLPFDPGMMLPVVPGAGEFTLNDGTVLSIREQILLLARAYSVPADEIGTQSERDRVTFQTDYFFDDNSQIQLSLMHTEEEFSRSTNSDVFFYDPLWADGDTDTVGANNAQGIIPIWNPEGVNEFTGELGIWEWNTGMGAPMLNMGSPTTIEEDYAELRWVSPGDDDWNYVIGASYYTYDYLEENYGNSDMNAIGVAYGALGNGIVDEFQQLTGLAFEPDESILSEQATNRAAYFNIGWDISDTLTASFEGRYQEDNIKGTAINGASIELTTESFLPRVALTWTPSNETTFYAQYSEGVNPAGVNVDLLVESTQDSIATGIQYGLIPVVDGIAPEDFADDRGRFVEATTEAVLDELGITDPTERANFFNYQVDYSPEEFQTFEEEELANFEIGFKGTLLDGDLTYAGAFYWIEWKNQLQSAALDWDTPCADDQLFGLSEQAAVPGDPLSPLIPIPPCTFTVDGVEQDYYYVPRDTGASANNVGANFGDVDLKGLELEWSYRLSQAWRIRGTATIAEAEYKNYCDIDEQDQGFHNNPAYVALFGFEQVLPSDPGANVASACYVADGNDVAFQPKVAWSLSPQYSMDVFGDVRFQGRMDLVYEGSQYTTSSNYAKLPATYKANLTLGLSSDVWSATFYVNNLFDDNTPTRITSGGDNTDNLGIFNVPANREGITDITGVAYEIGDQGINPSRSNYIYVLPTPRTYGLRLHYNF